MAEWHLTHGHARHGFETPTYRSWASMRRRCIDMNHHHWDLYGGRGIMFEDRWEDFENFLADMGERPDGTTLDRTDPNGPYSKTNCRWATPKEQVNNLRTNRVLVVGPLQLTVSDWAELVGIPRHTIFGRLDRGWKPVDAVTKPVNTKHRRKVAQLDN